MESPSLTSSSMYNICAQLAGRCIIDTRDKSKFDEGHIRGAMHKDNVINAAGKKAVLVLESDTPFDAACISAQYHSVAVQSFNDMSGFSQRFPFLLVPSPKSSDERGQQQRQAATQMFPAEVLENLFVGGQAEASGEVVALLGITHILCLLENKVERPADVCFLPCPL